MNRCLSSSLAIVFAVASLLFSLTGSAEETSRIGLVVQFLDGSIQKRCIEIDADEIKGIDVLNHSGLEIQAEYNSSMGAAICKIGSDGCSPQNCFCDMPNYWSYWHLQKDANDQWRWMYSQIGVSNYTVTPGQVEGWRYGAGQPPEEIPMFDEVCASASFTPTNTATATTVSTPTNTATLTSTSTPTGTSTPTQTPTSEWTNTPIPIAATIVSNSSYQITYEAWGTQPTFVVSDVVPSETPTPIPSPQPTTNTPSPSPTQTSLPTLPPSPATYTYTPLPSPTTPINAITDPTFTPIPTEAVTATETPIPSCTTTIVHPTKKSSWANKSSQATPGIPVAQADLTQQGISMLRTDTSAQPALPDLQPKAEAQQSTAFKTIFLVSGGLAGMLAFLVFFGVLGVGLIIVLIWKRR